MSYSFLIFDEIELVSDAIAIVIKNKYTDALVMQASKPIDLFKISKVLNFDIVIIDLNCNGKNNFKLLERLYCMQPNIKFLVLSSSLKTYFNIAQISFPLSYLYKECSSLIFLEILEATLNGKNVVRFSADTKTIRYSKTNIFKKPNITNLLSSREHELALLFITGVTNKELCHRFDLAMSTISTYKQRILRKTKCVNVIELATVFNTL